MASNDDETRRQRSAGERRRSLGSRWNYGAQSRLILDGGRKYVTTGASNGLVEDIAGRGERTAQLHSTAERTLNRRRERQG